MLDAYGNMLIVNMIRVSSLCADRLGDRHLRLDVRVLAPAFPMAWPSRVPAKVHHRREYPWHHCRTGLIGDDFTHLCRISPFKRGGKIDFLREEGRI